MGDLGKIIIAIGFEKLPKVQKIAQSGHTGLAKIEPTLYSGRPVMVMPTSGGRSHDQRQRRDDDDRQKFQNVRHFLDDVGATTATLKMTRVGGKIVVIDDDDAAADGVWRVVDEQILQTNYIKNVSKKRC